MGEEMLYNFMYKTNVQLQAVGLPGDDALPVLKPKDNCSLV
jgi:hypothetical protein